jgi:chromate transporter
MHPKAMSNAVAKPAPAPIFAGSPAAQGASIRDVFLEFLLIGATSFGGGVVAYLRSGLVAKREWIDDKEFVEMLAISQTLPGLNATNMAMLVGDKLRGALGSLAAIIGICLPGAVLMYIVGMLYQVHGSRPVVTAMLKGVAAAAIGLILATTVQLGRKSLAHVYDLVFIVLTVLGVNWLHQSVPRVLIAVGIIAVLWYHPRRAEKENVR